MAHGGYVPEIVPLTRARAKLAELIEEVRAEGNEKIITRNGKSCAALIGADKLDHYHGGKGSTFI